MKQNKEFSKFSFLILIAIVWMATSLSMSAKAAGMPSIKKLSLNLRGGTKTYYWTHGDNIIHDEDSFTVGRGQVLRLILVNNTKTDFILNMNNRRFKYVEGGGTQGDTMPSDIYLASGNRTIVEVPGDMYRSWRLGSAELYNLQYVDLAPSMPAVTPPMYDINTSMSGVPRTPESPRYEARRGGIPISNNSNESNEATAFSGSNWYKDLLLYSNFYGINTSAWSGRTGVDFMFEKGYSRRLLWGSRKNEDREYRWQLDLAYNFFENFDAYVGYEKDKDENYDHKHFHIAGHYTFKWFEVDLTYDKDDSLVLRLRTEIPLENHMRIFADYDTNHDLRLKYLYDYTNNLAFGINYHWRYRAGVGVEYAF